MTCSKRTIKCVRLVRIRRSCRPSLTTSMMMNLASQIGTLLQWTSHLKRSGSAPPSALQRFRPQLIKSSRISSRNCRKQRRLRKEPSGRRKEAQESPTSTSPTPLPTMTNRESAVLVLAETVRGLVGVVRASTENSRVQPRRSSNHRLRTIQRSNC